jgi:hypothetical protein
MSGRGDVNSKDMFPSPTIYDNPATPASQFPIAKVAEFLGLKEDEIGIIIIEKRSSGGHNCTKVVVPVTAKATSTMVGKDVLLESIAHGAAKAFLKERKKNEG